MARTNDEKAGIKLSIAALKTSPHWATYETELKRLQSAIASGMYRSSGENLAKEAGVVHGIDIAINIENFV